MRRDLCSPARPSLCPAHWPPVPWLPSQQRPRKCSAPTSVRHLWTLSASAVTQTLRSKLEGTDQPEGVNDLALCCLPLAEPRPSPAPQTRTLRASPVSAVQIQSDHTESSRLFFFLMWKMSNKMNDKMLPDLCVCPPGPPPREHKPLLQFPETPGITAFVKNRCAVQHMCASAYCTRKHGLWQKEPRGLFELKDSRDRGRARGGGDREESSSG